MISEERKSYLRKYYLNNKEQIAVKTKAYRDKNKEEILVKDRLRRQGDEKHLERCRAYGAKVEVKAKNREKNLRAIGWNTEAYITALTEQGGVCAICKKTEVSERYSRLAADHKHVVPPKPRGLLCNKCNKGLGLFLDSPELLKEAALYLEAHDG